MAVQSAVVGSGTTDLDITIHKMRNMRIDGNSSGINIEWYDTKSGSPVLVGEIWYPANTGGGFFELKNCTFLEHCGRVTFNRGGATAYNYMFWS